MKAVRIYEPVMCCNTGVSGVGINSELMRMSKLMKIFLKEGIDVKRLDLSKTPQEFMKNTEVMGLIQEKKTDILPITVVEDKVVLMGRYPTNEEFAKFLEIPIGMLEQEAEQERITNDTGCCDTGCCCN